MGIRKGQNTWWNKNPYFVKAGVLMIFSKNYGVKLDPHEIDSKLTIGENISELYHKFKLFINKPWLK
jgi:hypothetical protein